MAKGKKGLPQPPVPDTISDRQMASLRRRAQDADTEPWFTARATRQRISSLRNRDQAHLN